MLIAAAPSRHATKNTPLRILPSLALGGLLAAIAIALGSIAWLQNHRLSTLTIAIALGMLMGNTVYGRVADASCAGVAFSKQNLRRLGIVLYGLRLTLQDIGQVGLAGVNIDAVVLTSTFALACVIGVRWFNLDTKTAILIGAGSSICGAAAVLATEPVVRARAEQVTVVASAVVVFGTVSIFLYPLLFDLNERWQRLPGGARAVGMYAGSTIHEVAQVVAAARSMGQDAAHAAEAADAAVIAKMVRVVMLAPSS